MALSLRRRPRILSRHQCRRIVRLLHRSCPLSFVDWRTVDVFLEYVLPRLNCSIRGCFTSTRPVSFSGPTARHYPLQPPSPVLPWIVLLPFSFPGVAKTGHPLSFRSSRWETIQQRVAVQTQQVRRGHPVVVGGF